MLEIRLLRIGKKNQPSFKIVVVDKRKSSKAGRYTEEVGFYNPLTKGKKLEQDRIKYWLSVGAKPTETVHNLLVSEKIIEAKKIPSHKKAKKAGDEGKPSSSPSPAGAGSVAGDEGKPSSSPSPAGAGSVAGDEGKGAGSVIDKAPEK